ncbi:MAG: hypothetical protein UZ08_BCD001000325 [Candidatus Parvibacillus calidus]|nr:MAG: hypothetical protein UZ08_BCD001000325 [Candidatus Parvibacillus calidus]
MIPRTYQVPVHLGVVHEGAPQVDGIVVAAGEEAVGEVAAPLPVGAGEEEVLVAEALAVGAVEPAGDPDYL